MIAQGMASVNNMFGVPEIPVRRIDFEENAYDAPQSDFANAVFQSDIPAEDFPSDFIQFDGQQAEEPARQTAPPPAASAAEQRAPGPGINRPEDFCCDKCGVIIPEKVWDYSCEKFGRPLCMKCQKEERRR